MEISDLASSVASKLPELIVWFIEISALACYKTAIDVDLYIPFLPTSFIIIDLLEQQAPINMLTRIKENKIGIDIGGTLAKLAIYIDDEMKANKSEEWLENITQNFSEGKAPSE